MIAGSFVLVGNLDGDVYGRGDTKGVSRDDRHPVGGLGLKVQLRPGSDRDLPLGIASAELTTKEDASAPPKV